MRTLRGNVEVLTIYQTHVNNRRQLNISMNIQYIVIDSIHNTRR